jgi:hypothetical protein
MSRRERSEAGIGKIKREGRNRNSDKNDIEQNTEKEPSQYKCFRRPSREY